MRRRQFLVLSSGISISLLMNPAYSLAPNEASVLHSYIESLVGVSELGQAYLGRVNPQVDILSLLEQKLNLSSSSNGIQEVNRVVLESIERDFMKFNFCLIEGWQLTETECLLAASQVVLFPEKIGQSDGIEKTFENAPYEEFLTVESWGPRSTIQGEVFNRQPDGHAGLWIITDQQPIGLSVYINGKREFTRIHRSGVTSGVHDLDDVETFINTVGETEIVLYDELNHRRQVVGMFSVLPRPKKLEYQGGKVSKVFCPVEAWGPKIAKKGAGFNIQPNGDSAVWIKMKCAPRMARIVINGKAIKTTVQPGLVTGGAPIEDIPVIGRQYQVELYDSASQELLTIGRVQIN